MKNIFSKASAEKRTQNGVKSYSFPTRLLSPILIFTFLTLGVGQMWGGESFWQVDMTYSFNGTTELTKTFYSSDNKTAATDLGTMSSGTFTVTKAKWHCWADWQDNTYCFMWYKINGGDATYKSCYSSGASYYNNDKGNHYPESNYTWTIAKSTDASGSYTLNFGWYSQFSWGDGNNQYDIKNSQDAGYQFTYKIAPPAVSGFGVTTSGYLAGSGTEGDPYLVKSGNSLTFTVSGSKARTDDNSTFNYWLNSGAKQTSGTLSTGSITSSDLQSAVIHGQCINNSSSSLVGTESTSTIYYKAVSVKDISVYIYVGGCAPAQINSIELFGTPCVGSVAQAAVHKYIGDFTTDGDWRKYTFTNVSEVRNVVVAREGGRAVDNITITDDIYYKFDGTKLDGKCVPPANPTWGTAPANGVIGGSMTASVSGAPAGATITWSSTNPSAATVNSSGVISYVAAGNTTITARVTWSATGDYCAGSYDLTKEISCTSGATVSVERTCAAYVAAGVAGQVSAHITFTGTSSGWKYRIKQSWSAGYETGWLDASGTSADWTMTGGMDAVERTYTVELYTTEGAATPVSTANFSVTGETAYNTTIAAGANGSVSPSGTVYANNNHVHPTITATPNEHYHFVNWTSNNAASVADANSATTTVTATASGYTITANFAGDKYTITYKDQGGVDYSGNNEGSLPATHTYGTATTLVNGTKEGFTFGGWYTNSECTVSAGSSIGATAKTSNFTLYAKWTEKMSALSTSNHYNVGNPGYAAPTVSNSATNVGYETTRTITATAVGTGYRFVGWTLTNCTRTDGGEATANQITIRSNGDGAAASVVANYEEDLSTEWKIIGQSPSDKANSPFSSWTYASSTNTMAKATGHSTESVAYSTISVPAASVTGEYYEFKISNGTTHYGYGESEGYYILFDKTKTDQSVYSNNNNDHALRFKPNVAGDYTFKIDYSNNTKKVSVTFPTAYRVTYGVGTGYTSMGGVSSSPNITSGDYVIAGTKITFTATPNLGYKFVGWYNNEACTGDAISINATYNIASLNANTTLYAKFDYRPLYIHADFAPNGWDTPVQMTQSTENRAVYTYEIDQLVAKSGTPATEGHHFHFVNTVENPNGNKAYNYYGVQTPTGSGFLTNENIHLTDAGNPTIQFDLTRKSKITITLTLQSIDDNPQPTVNIAADPYYTVNTARGSYDVGITTISPASVEARSGANSAAITATIAPGYTFVNWTPNNSNITINSPNDPTTTVRATGDGTLIANATPNHYAVHFDGNGNTGGSMSDMPALTYGVAFKLTANAFTKTGYTFAGWALSANDEVRYADEEEVSNLTDVNNGTATLYAKWTPKNYTVTLDKQTSAEGYGGNEGTVANQTVTFDATPATVSGSMPIAKNGWAFMGFYSATGGNGRCFIDPSGNWVTTAGDTIRYSKWVHDGDVTLYAYYKKAQITNLIFDAAVVAPGTEVGVTPFVDPKPAGTNSICWKLLYNNGNLYTPQPSFKNPREIANKVTFTAPNTSGMYLVAAVLRTGTDCNGGTKLDSVTYPFQVAGDHTVTVQYKCGNTTIKASTSATGKPLEWTEVVAHDIFGYYFSGWTAGDGVTIEEAAAGRLAELQAEDASIVAVIKMKAIYDGKLTANYSKRDYIYFKSTALGWNNVYVYFYTNNGYWDNDKGAGATGAACIGKGQMSLVPGETDIYYWDYGTGITGGPSAATKYVAFTWGDCTNHGNFYGNASSYPTNGNNQGFNAGTPMFVPISQEENYKKNATPYYDRGYWTQYIGGTGYSIDIFHANGTYDKSINFEEGDSEGMPFTANVYLNGGSNLYFKVHRSSGMYYYSTTNVTMSNAATAMPLTYDSGASKKTTISTNVAGDYLFSLTCASDGKLNVTVKYPAKSGDYRLLYSDDIQTKPLASDVVHQENNSRDTVSFFVRPESHPVLKIQKATVTDGGAITWSAGTDISSSLTSLTKDSVYNICLQMNESGAISVENVAFYTGNFYIRTDAANSKWDNYRAADHLMTYSEYSKDHSDYTHYFVKFVREGTNVKFVVANDYSPCISDTLIQSTYRGSDASHVDEHGFLNNDLPGDGVNVRYMWDIRNNAVMRAYLAPAQKNGSKFLVLRSNSSEDLRDEYDDALTGDSEGFPGNNHGGGANCMQFVDNENWIYEATVMVRPSAYVKLYGYFHGDNFYYKGTEDDIFDDAHAIKLVEGSGARVKVRVIYDFKTDRLLAAMVPSGEISTEMAINADVMFIREHQGDIEQLIFNGNGNITNIKTAYGVMRFNKWTLNNREKTGDHIPLVSPASIYERAMYFISFPFEVKLSEVFGFGTYGQDWIIEYYDGAERARTGWWEGQPGFWRYVWDRKNFVLKPNVGYLLELELGNFKEGSGFWNNKNERLELFFPSSGPLGSITNASVTQTLPAHKCDINRAATEGLPETSDPSTSYNRTVFDSHWNIMSVPTYVNVDDPNFVNTTWIGGEKGNVGPKFLYTWNMDDNTLTATSGKGFMYHAMHAYTVQYYGNVTWTTSVTPTAAPQRNTEYRGEYEFCLEVQQDDQMIDRTYVRLSDDENVTTGFEFSEDMTKQFNSRKANIFTIAGNTSLGGNSLPLSTTQTTVVPVGVKIKTAGDYTFSIPDGTNGVGITLIDEETGIRTSLSALDYTVNLTAGDYTERFWLEISPIYNTPTGIEEPTSDSSLKGRAQKRIIDGVLYIVKDGKIFDARGTRVE